MRVVLQPGAVLVCRLPALLRRAAVPAREDAHTLSRVPAAVQILKQAVARVAPEFDKNKFYYVVGDPT